MLPACPSLLNRSSSGWLSMSTTPGLSAGWTRAGPTAPSATIRQRRIPAPDELPEVEKDYDRETAIETLNVVKALGYTIIPPEDSDRTSVY